MVRRLVSTQVAVAKGDMLPELMATYLAGQPGGLVQGLAPPQGLFLVEVAYPPGLDEDNTEGITPG
jgi:tRNA U38,U39,U40 pseudouridine synthase TruA